MPDLSVENIDEVNIRVRCERSTAKELSDFFTFKVPGHRYMPAYRSRVWDGTIKLYNMFSQEIYKGLGDYVRSFADQRSYSIEFPDKKDNFFTESMVSISWYSLLPTISISRSSWMRVEVDPASVRPPMPHWGASC